MGAIFETLGALLVGLMVLGIVAWGLNTAFSSAKLSETEQGIITMRMQTQALFSGTDYTGLTNALAITSGTAPDMFVKGNSLINAWGGAITLTAIPADAAFSIALAGIPQEECTKLARFQADAWKSISINAADVTASTVAQVVAACIETNTILFVSR